MEPSSGEVPPKALVEQTRALRRGQGVLDGRHSREHSQGTPEAMKAEKLVGADTSFVLRLLRWAASEAG